MMQTTLHVTILNRAGITDKKYGDRLSRYAAAFPYVCKALLRGKSVTDPGESGQDLVARGLLSQDELDDFKMHPCWEPYYIIDLMNNVVANCYHPAKKGASGYEREHVSLSLTPSIFRFVENGWQLRVISERDHLDLKRS